MTKQENEIYPEEIQAEKEGLFEQLLFLDGGRTLELFYDIKSKEPQRFYIRDQDGKLTEFTDLTKPNDIYDYHKIKYIIAEKFKITVTDGEAKEIADKIYKINVKADMDSRKVLE